MPRTVSIELEDAEIDAIAELIIGRLQAYSQILESNPEKLEEVKLAVGAYVPLHQKLLKAKMFSLPES
jgi:hypothetical protein